VYYTDLDTTKYELSCLTNQKRLPKMFNKMTEFRLAGRGED
jgi:hypothetical protein